MTGADARTAKSGLLVVTAAALSASAIEGFFGFAVVSAGLGLTPVALSRLTRRLGDRTGLGLAATSAGGVFGLSYAAAAFDWARSATEASRLSFGPYAWHWALMVVVTTVAWAAAWGFVATVCRDLLAAAAASCWVAVDEVSRWCVEAGGYPF